MRAIDAKQQELTEKNCLEHVRITKVRPRLRQKAKAFAMR